VAVLLCIEDRIVAACCDQVNYDLGSDPRGDTTNQGTFFQPASFVPFLGVLISLEIKASADPSSYPRSP